MSNFLRLYSSAKTFNTGPEPTTGTTPALRVVSLQGHEELARLYRYEMTVVHTDANIDATKLIGNPARIEFGTPTSVERHVFGRITEFEFLKWESSKGFYRAVLEPRISDLRNTRRSRFFKDRIVSQLIGDVLSGYNSSSDYNTSGISTTTTKTVMGAPIQVPVDLHPSRPYVAQYEESDFDFLMRWLEHDGIFYHFQQGTDSSGCDKVVFGESTAAYQAGATTPWPFQTASGAASEIWEANTAQEIQTAALKVTRLPATVKLRDYDPVAAVQIEATATVTGGLAGVVTLYDNNFTTQDTGNALATIRAKELSCRGQILSGQSNVRALRAGYKFQMNNHPRSDFNATDYVVISLDITATQDHAEAGSIGSTFVNKYVAIKADQQFVPQRVTAWPRISGSMHARVGTGSTTGDVTQRDYADLDDQGNYILQTGPDNYATQTHRIRMAQPYAGDGYGFHMPLHQNTEVIVTHMNGNPDKPIIAAAVPNPTKKSPVTSDNYTTARMVSGGRNHISFQDLTFQQGIVINAGNYFATTETAEIIADYFTPAQMFIGTKGAFPGSTSIERTSMFINDTALFNYEAFALNNFAVNSMRSAEFTIGFRPLMFLKLAVTKAFDTMLNESVKAASSWSETWRTATQLLRPLTQFVIALVIAKAYNTIIDRALDLGEAKSDIRRPAAPVQGVARVKRWLKTILAGTRDLILGGGGPVAFGVYRLSKVPLGPTSTMGTIVKITNSADDIMLMTDTGAIEMSAGGEMHLSANSAMLKGATKSTIEGVGASVEVDTGWASMRSKLVDATSSNAIVKVGPKVDAIALATAHTDFPVKMAKFAADTAAMQAWDVLNAARPGAPATPELPGKPAAAVPVDWKAWPASKHFAQLGVHYDETDASKWNDVFADDEALSIRAKQFTALIADKGHIDFRDAEGMRVSSNVAKGVTIRYGSGAAAQAPDAANSVFEGYVQVSADGIKIVIPADKPLTIEGPGGAKFMEVATSGAGAKAKLTMDGLDEFTVTAGKITLSGAQMVELKGTSKINGVVQAMDPAVPAALAAALQAATAANTAAAQANKVAREGQDKAEAVKKATLMGKYKAKFTLLQTQYLAAYALALAALTPDAMATTGEKCEKIRAEFEALVIEARKDGIAIP